ncbi:hypothetical protein STEG23_006065, partial [Scotinomys teguina]
VDQSMRLVGQEFPGIHLSLSLQSLSCRHHHCASFSALVVSSSCESFKTKDHIISIVKPAAVASILDPQHGLHGNQLDTCLPHEFSSPDLLLWVLVIQELLLDSELRNSATYFQVGPSNINQGNRGHPPSMSLEMYVT